MFATKLPANQFQAPKPLETTQSVLLQLEQLPYKFYLTGSRFFGGEHADSDWDFFVDNSEELIITLKKMGFHRLSDENYNCLTKFDILMRKIVGIQPHIDIQLLHGSAQNKDKIQKLMRSILPNFGKEVKSQRRVIWKLFQTTQDYLEKHSPLLKA